MPSDATCGVYVRLKVIASVEAETAERTEVAPTLVSGSSGESHSQ